MFVSVFSSLHGSALCMARSQRRICFSVSWITRGSKPLVSRTVRATYDSSHRVFELRRTRDLDLVYDASSRDFDEAAAHIFFAHIGASWQFLAGESSDARELEDALFLKVTR